MTPAPSLIPCFMSTMHLSARKFAAPHLGVPLVSLQDWLKLMQSGHAGEQIVCFGAPDSFRCSACRFPAFRLPYQAIRKKNR